MIGSWKMYTDGSASVAHSLLLLTHKHKQSFTLTAYAFIEKADLKHRRKGFGAAGSGDMQDPLRLCVTSAFSSIAKAVHV